MTQNEFSIAALAILSRNRELQSGVLKDAINEHLHPQKVRFDRFIIYMHALCSEGAVNKELRVAPTQEQHLIRGGARVAYYSITKQGKKIRSQFALQENTGEGTQYHGIPVIQPKQARTRRGYTL